MRRQRRAPAPASGKADKGDRAALGETADRGDMLGRAAWDLPPSGQYLVIDSTARIIAILGSVLRASLALPMPSRLPTLVRRRARRVLWALAVSFAFKLRSLRSAIERE
jgi:hypothetical protein